MFKKLIHSVLYKLFDNKVVEYKNILTDALLKNNTSILYDQGEKLQIIGDNHQVIGTEKTPTWRTDFAVERKYKGSSYTILTNAFLVGIHGTVVYKGKIALASILNGIGYLLHKSDKRRIAYHYLIPTTKTYEKGISLGNCLANTYFHWVAETLPMLQALMEYQKNNSDTEEFYVFVNQGVPKFVFEYLNLFGVPKDRIVELSTNKIKVQKLILPSPRFYTLKNPHDYWNRHIYPKSAFDFLRKSLLKGEISTSKHTKYYLSRKDAGGRGIQNEDVLIEMLEKSGFVSVVLSDLDVQSQIELFRSATDLVAPHGAGMVNTIFSDTINILELYPKTRAFGYNYHFYQISNHYKHKHTMLLCECDENQNMVVEISQVKELLN